MLLYAKVTFQLNQPSWSYVTFSDKSTFRIISVSFFSCKKKWFIGKRNCNVGNQLKRLYWYYFVFKFLEKPLLPVGVGPVYLQQKRKFKFPGSKYLINRKEKRFFSSTCTILSGLCQYFAVYFTFINQQRSNLNSGGTGEEFD